MSQIKIEIHPLSVNRAWVGRRFKTPEYIKYEQDVLFLLPHLKIPQAPYRLEIEYGFSNKASDVDNPTKLWIDIMQRKYGFNDKDIYELYIVKKIVPKKQEYIKFEILNADSR